MPKPKNSSTLPLPQGIRDIRHLTQQLNMLKRQILGMQAQTVSILRGLNTMHKPVKYNMGGAWPTDFGSTIKVIVDDHLQTLQAIATAYGIRGDYTRVLPFEETRFGKKIIEREWAALPERFRIRTLPLEECQRLFKLHQDSLAQTSPEERKLIAGSLSSRSDLGE